MKVSWDDEIPNWMEKYPLVNQHNYGKSPFSMAKSTISMGHVPVTTNQLVKSPAEFRSNLRPISHPP